jgi:EAL domain-containing protein (putative c-di-GMP-specific phosphodiesterase class I)
VVPPRLSLVPPLARESHDGAPAPAPRGPEGALALVAAPTELDEIRRVLDRGLFTTEYQAIVQTRTGRTSAFEALARFRGLDGRALAPGPIFGALRVDPALFLRAELTLKLHQVEHAPRAPLFVNLDPECWARAGDGRTNPFLGLFASSSNRVVVEVTEALAAADAARAHDMVTALRGRRVHVALDDLGAASGLLSFDAISEAEVLKFDRTLLPRLRHPRARALVQALVRMAHETGARSILEGVESTAEFVIARDLGFDFVQGFLFRDRARLARR